MSEPTQTCQLCGRVVIVEDSGRGFPPDNAKRKLVKRCKADGCPCDPKYRAGVSKALMEVLSRRDGVR